MASSNVRSKIDQFDAIVEGENLTDKGSKKLKPKTKRRVKKVNADANKSSSKENILLQMVPFLLALLYGLYLYYVVTHLLLAGDVDIIKNNVDASSKVGENTEARDQFDRLKDHGQEFLDCSGTFINSSPTSNSTMENITTAGNDVMWYKDWYVD